MAHEPLSAEAREVRELVRTLARERSAPRASEIDTGAEVPRELGELRRAPGDPPDDRRRGVGRRRLERSREGRRDRGGLEVRALSERILALQGLGCDAKLTRVQEGTIAIRRPPVAGELPAEERFPPPGPA